MVTAPEIERLLSREEVGELLGVSPSGVARIIARGDLPIVRVGRRTLVRPSDLRRFVEEHTTRQNDDAPAATGATVTTSAGDGGGDAAP
jgi:excisionase family DNA binding protein